jgi:hypothetical protein
MKHIKSFDTSLIKESMTLELPEGYVLDLFNPNNKKDAMEHFKSANIEDWFGLSFEEWLETLKETGVIQYPNNSGEFFRGTIEWPEKGFSYIYEIHPA